MNVKNNYFIYLCYKMQLYLDVYIYVINYIILKMQLYFQMYIYTKNMYTSVAAIIDGITRLGGVFSITVSILLLLLVGRVSKSQQTPRSVFQHSLFFILLNIKAKNLNIIIATFFTIQISAIRYKNQTAHDSQHKELLYFLRPFMSLKCSGPRN